MTLGQRIYQYRTRQKLSQLELAERLEVSRQSISKWETDASVPELEKLVKMCGLFGVSLDQLVRGVEVEMPKPAAAAQEPVVIVQKMPARLIVGGVLLLCGIMIFALSFFELGEFLESAFLGCVFLIPGIICLRAQENAAAWCFFAELAIWFVLLPLLNVIASY